MTSQSAAAASSTPFRRASPATRAWTSAATTACRSTAAYADKSPFAFTGKVKKVVFDINPHLEDAHEQELHEHSPQALAAHAINA